MIRVFDTVRYDGELWRVIYFIDPQTVELMSMKEYLLPTPTHDTYNRKVVWADVSKLVVVTE